MYSLRSMGIFIQVRSTYLSLFLFNNLADYVLVSTSEVTPETTLNEYLRNYEYLRGTKFMCREGGCGVCIVAVSTIDSLTKRRTLFSVNSVIFAKTKQNLFKHALIDSNLQRVNAALVYDVFFRNTQ